MCTSPSLVVSVAERRLIGTKRGSMQNTGGSLGIGAAERRMMRTADRRMPDPRRSFEFGAAERGMMRMKRPSLLNTAARSGWAPLSGG